MAAKISPWIRLRASILLWSPGLRLWLWLWLRLSLCLSRCAGTVARALFWMVNGQHLVFAHSGAKSLIRQKKKKKKKKKKKSKFRGKLLNFVRVSNRFGGLSTISPPDRLCGAFRLNLPRAGSISMLPADVQRSREARNEAQIRCFGFAADGRRAAVGLRQMRRLGRNPLADPGEDLRWRRRALKTSPHITLRRGELEAEQR